MNENTLVRTHDGRILGGVCSGIAHYTGLDLNLVRLLAVVLTILSGVGVLAYLAAWLIIPEEGRSASILQNLVARQQLN
jgi:phage shock protein PspC (stress-responsive transcriptional regulator)